MSAKWVGYFLDEAKDIQDPTELLLAIAIADHADANGSAYPGMKLLAKKIRRDLRTVQRLVNALESYGYLEVVRGRGRGKLSKFQLKKVTHESPLSDSENPTPASPFNAPKKAASMSSFNEIKGDMAKSEKVTYEGGKGDIAMSSPPTPPYKDEPFKPLERVEPFARARETDPLELFFSITKLAIPDALLDDVRRALGDNPDPHLLEKCFRAWCLRGYRPQNLAWLTEWYAEKKIPDVNRAQQLDRSRPIDTYPKYDPASEPKYDCSTCVDCGWISVPDPDAEFDWMMKDVPCPKCERGRKWAARTPEERADEMRV